MAAHQQPSSLTSFTAVPVVDVSGLGSDAPAAQQAVADELGRAAREVGFLYVTGTGIDSALFMDLLDVTQRFFGLPLEDKMRVYIGRSTNHRGYVPEGEEVFAGGTRDRKEAYDCGLELPPLDPDVLAGTFFLGPNQWPDLAGFAAAVTAWYDAVMALGRRLLRGFALALGEEPGLFDAAVTKPPSQLRLLHYPYDPDTTDAVGIGAHTDYECFTLLKPTAPGLEVLNAAGAWIDVPPLADAFVVNVATFSRPGPTGGSSPPATACAGSARSGGRSRCSSTSTTRRGWHRCRSSRVRKTLSGRRSSPASTCSPRPRRPSSTSRSGSPAASSRCRGRRLPSRASARSPARGVRGDGLGRPGLARGGRRSGDD